jgi:hypothetical protein
MKFNKKIVETWSKYLVFSFITAIGIIGKSPFEFDGHDWKQCLNAVWISLVPVIIKWANPKDEMTLTIKK